MSEIYKGIIGDITVIFRLKYGEKAAAYFGEWLLKTEEGENPVFVKDEDFVFFKEKWNVEDNAYSEYSLLVYRACDELLKYDRCLFHGAAFLWHKKAYIFTAPSGTGKSTQLKNWIQLYGDEIEIMNGDKPVLKNDGNHVTVMPSPWKGKERLGNDTLIAPLGGIIILEQGEENRIIKLDTNHSVPFLLKRILSVMEQKALVLNAGKMVETIVTSVPVWKLINKGDLHSAELTYQTITGEQNV